MKWREAAVLLRNRAPRTSDEFAKLPAHVAVIMDGNGRWARKHKLNVSMGHRQGTENLREIIRLVFPELNEERRKDLTKIASRGAEEAKVAIRSIRRDGIEQIKKLKKNSEITEDDQHDAEEDMQKLTDKAIKQVDEIFAKKEKEIMEV